MNAKQNTRQIIELLRLRHPPLEWATFTELHYIDFFAFHMWKSKGFWRVAYEIKVSRSDFSRELNQPDKRLPAEELANECFFVAPVNLIMIDEIPEGWGLIEVNKGGLRKKKHAKQRKENDSLPMSFTAKIARKSVEPPSDVPDVFWKYAGQELNSDEVIKMADSLMEVNEYGIREDERKKTYAEADYLAGQRLSRIIQQHLGWDYDDPEKLEEWFKQKHNGIVSRELKWSLKRTKSVLDELLETLD
jgi:hypothetical protein